MSSILAIDLGKFNSVFCWYAGSSGVSGVELSVKNHRFVGTEKFLKR